MKSVIEKIYKGETSYQDIAVTEEWKRLAEKSLKIYERFYPSLTEEQKKQYDELYYYESGQEAEVARRFYEEGFKLGFMLAMEGVGS